RRGHAAGAVADAPRVAERGEDDAIPLGDTPLVRAAASADDPARRAADEERRRALEPEQERLHRVAEGVVPPAPVPADDPVAGDDHGHRIPAEGVADGARGAWVADAPRERRVRDDLAERDARGLRQHRGLEFGHPVEIHRRSPSARRRIVLPRASWLLTVLTEIPRTRASSRYERPLT